MIPCSLCSAGIRPLYKTNRAIDARANSTKYLAIRPPLAEGDCIRAMHASVGGFGNLIQLQSGFLLPFLTTRREYRGILHS